MKAKSEINIDNLPKGVILLTIEDVANALQVSRSFVEKLMAKGGIRVVKVGRHNRFLPVDVENYIKENLY
ncbi:hypothetical protein FACS189416_6540 [Bacteroidia bacterium]|nr:hypothetical protein FACS189416_6540 [Bacteroidia bacterium]